MQWVLNNLLVPSRRKVETIFLALAARCLLLQGSRVLDSSGEYETVLNLSAPSERLKPFDVTLTSQCSHEHLKLLTGLVTRWQGPISVSVYSESEDVPGALWNIANLVACSSLIKMYVSFHLVFPLLGKNSTEVSIAPSLVTRQPCQWANSSEKNYAKKSSYPVNLLRNVARNNTATDFIFMIDIDLLPSSNLRQDFVCFATKMLLDNPGVMDSKVFVVPAFEVKSEVSAPSDKSQLLSLADSGKARPSYDTLCNGCQGHTKSDKWKKENISAQLSVSYEVTWGSQYEPFYIALRNVPPFDERFRQYGYNRISQACELHLAGYDFAILNNAFLVHQGWKNQGSFHADKEKEVQMNRVHYDRFRDDLKLKYPESSRQCTVE